MTQLDLFPDDMSPLPDVTVIEWELTPYKFDLEAYKSWNAYQEEYWNKLWSSGIYKPL